MPFSRFYIALTDSFKALTKDLFGVLNHSPKNQSWTSFSLKPYTSFTTIWVKNKFSCCSKLEILRQSDNYLCSSHCCLFRCLLSLFCFLGSPDNVFSLSLPNFRFLIPLGHYISKRGTSYGPLEFDCTASSFLLNFFLQNRKMVSMLRNLASWMWGRHEMSGDCKGALPWTFCTNPIHGGSALMTVSSLKGSTS